MARNNSTNNAMNLESTHQFVGAIDQWGAVIRGWCYEISSPESPTLLGVFVDGKQMGVIPCDSERLDVAASGHPTANCGLNLNIGAMVTDSEFHLVELVDIRSGIAVFSSGADFQCRSHEIKSGHKTMGLQSIISVKYVLDELKAKISTERKVAFVSCFTYPGQRNFSLERLVVSLSNCGFPVVVIDASEYPTQMSVAPDLHIHRQNVGWDFASWFTALELLKYEIEDCLQVVLTNDSCIGPLGDLQKTFDRGAEFDLDVFSITDSWRGGYHMQSYFLNFGINVNQSGFLKQFFESYIFPIQKEKIVSQGEVALSQKLAAGGFSCGAIHSYRDLREQFLAEFPERLTNLLQSKSVLKLREVLPNYLPVEARSMIAIYEDLSSGQLVNPSHTFWELLVTRDCQFIKHDLLTKNPTDVHGLSRFFELVSQKTTVEDMKSFSEEIRGISNKVDLGSS